MRAYFLSDLHLGAPYFRDPRATERNVVGFLDSIRHDADAIFLLGDILDYWYEYRYVVPRGFVRFFGKLAELADAGVKIVWFIGNHDIWIFDYLPSELGIKVVDGYAVEEIDGHKFLMTHGDGIGKLKPSFRILRKFFRNKICQKLFSGIHPRWTVPFARNWSSHSRLTQGDGYGGPAIPDAERMLSNINTFSKEYLAEHPDIDFFVFGHLHLLRDYPIGDHSRIIILGEWIASDSYALWDGENMTLHRWSPQTDH